MSCPYKKSVANNELANQELLNVDKNPKYYKPTDEDIKSGVYERSPCPALNILANHGYINRDGKDIDRKSLVDASNKVFGVPYFITNSFVASVQFVFGLGSKFDLSDISRKDWLEHDGSLFHDDYTKDSYWKPNSRLVEDLINLSNDNKGDDKNKITPANIATHRTKRLETCNLGWFHSMVSGIEAHLLSNYLNKSGSVDDLKTLIIEERLP
jgi:hypothetical protein